MTIQEDFREPGTVAIVTAIAENPLAGGSISEKRAAVDAYDDEEEWPATTDERERLFQREYSTGSVEVVDIVELPTFYTAQRLGPMTMLMALAAGLAGPIHTELLKLRVCEVALNISAQICANISEKEYKLLGDQVVKMTAEYQLYATLVGCLPPIIFSLFVGSWSDIFGRKLPMLVPLFGNFCATILLSVISYFMLHPVYILLHSLMGSLAGGWTILLMAKFSYIGDYTIEKNRALNIAVIDGILILFANVGGLLGGFLYQQFGLQIPFYVVTGLYGAAFLYVLFVIRDRVPRKKGASHGCGELFSTSRLRENFQTLIKVRIGDTRTHIYVLLFCLLIYSTCVIGDSSVTQLFLEFQPFNWDVQFYTIFNCINGLFCSMSLVVVMFAFRRFFGMPDTMISIIGSLSCILFFFGYGLARVSWMIYLATGLGVLRHLVIACIRSLLSGMVDPNEIGKIMSLISSIQALTPLLGSLIFTSLFAQTSSWYPGLCFTLAAFLCVPILAAFSYLDVVRRRSLYLEPVKSR